MVEVWRTNVSPCRGAPIPKMTFLSSTVLQQWQRVNFWQFDQGHDIDDLAKLRLSNVPGTQANARRDDTSTFSCDGAVAKGSETLKGRRPCSWRSRTFTISPKDDRPTTVINLNRKPTTITFLSSTFTELTWLPKWWNSQVWRWNWPSVIFMILLKIYRITYFVKNACVFQIAHGPDQWSWPVVQTNRPDQWSRPMVQTNGPDQ